MKAGVFQCLAFHSPPFFSSDTLCQSFQVLGKPACSLLFRGPGGDEADSGVVRVYGLLILELVAFSKLRDQIVGKDRELLVSGGIGEEGETAVGERFF